MSCFENDIFSRTLFHLENWLKPPFAYLKKISEEENNMQNCQFISVDIVLPFPTYVFYFIRYDNMFLKQVLAKYVG